MTFFSCSDSAWSPWGCRVCRCVLWAGLWCTGHRWAAPSQPGRSRTSATSGLWFSLSWQSSLWPEEEKTHVWLCSSIKTPATFWILLVLMWCVMTHGPVVYPLTVTVLQTSSQLPGQLAFVHVAVQVRQRVQHHDLQNTLSGSGRAP